MTLKSAIQDVKETTLSAVSGLLGKLAYLASLRHGPGYEHWGLELIHGQDGAGKALKAAHGEVVAEVLRSPLRVLLQDLEESSVNRGMGAQKCLEEMSGRFDDLLPEGRQNSPTSTHLNSVLAALSSLQKSQERATRSTS